MRALRCGLMAMLLLGVAASAVAQYAATFEELPAATTKGQRLFVFDREGNEIRGRLAAATADRVTLIVGKGTTREVMREEITLIRTPSHDSVLNGAAIGGGVAGAFALISLAECPQCTGVGPFLGGALLWGAGIGALVDASILTPRDVYRVGKRRVEVKPVVARSSTGIRVALAW